MMTVPGPQNAGAPQNASFQKNLDWNLTENNAVQKPVQKQSSMS